MNNPPNIFKIISLSGEKKIKKLSFDELTNLANLCEQKEKVAYQKTKSEEKKLILGLLIPISIITIIYIANKYLNLQTAAPVLTMVFILLIPYFILQYYQVSKIIYFELYAYSACKDRFNKQLETIKKINV